MIEFEKEPRTLFGIFVAIALIFSPLDAKSASTEANELFVNAVTLHRQAAEIPPEERGAKLREVRDLFDRILAEHADSGVAELIRSNPAPAGVVIADLPSSESHSVDTDTEAKQVDDRNGSANGSSTDVIVRRNISSADDSLLAPVGGVALTMSASYFDPDYPASWNPPAQHIGIDLPAPEGTVVRSPVTGRVVINRTDRSDSFNKYLIVRDSEGEQEHVFGHIDSDLALNAEVGLGNELGTIVSAGTGPHLHWGINNRRILDTFSDGWGFGRAPLGATRKDAQLRGWLDPEQWFETRAEEASTPERRIEENEAWVVQNDPDATLDAGEQGRGFAVSADGKATFQGKPLFGGYQAHNLDEQRLAVFVNDAEDRAIAIFMMNPPFSGVRFGIVDLTAGKILNDTVVPAWRYGAGDVAWDPKGTYVALPMPFAEFSTGLGIFELETGRYTTLPDRAFDASARDNWLADTLETRPDGTVAIDVALEKLGEYGTPMPSDGTPPENRTIEIEALFGAPASANDGKGAQHGAKPGPAANLASEWGPGIVVPASVELGYAPCQSASDKRSCLANFELSPEAIAFSMDEAHGDRRGQVFAIKFREFGNVDLAVTEFQGASPVMLPAFLNGQIGLSVVSGLSDNSLFKFSDGTSRAFLRNHAGVWSSRPIVSAHRALSDGRQRFIVVQPLSTCRACNNAGAAILAFDFDGSGRPLEERPVGIMDINLGSINKTGARISDVNALRREPAKLQYALNTLGYLAGSMDGVLGQMTRTALQDFQTEHCLSPTGEPDFKTLQALVQADGFSAPCALSDGFHTREARRTVRTGETAGDVSRAYSLAGRYGNDPLSCSDFPTIVDADGIKFYEKRCAFDTPIPHRAASHETGASCHGEGVIYRDTLSIELTSDGSLVVGEAHQRQTFSRCSGSNTSSDGRVAQTPAASIWSLQFEPTHSISPTETWGPLEVQADGSLYAGKTKIFPTAPDPEAARIDLYMSPNRKSALAIQFDTDWGGVRAQLVNLDDEARLAGPLISESAVRGQARPIDLRQPVSPIAWSPDGETLLVTVETAEFDADIIAVNRTTGSAQMLHKPETSGSRWLFPALQRLADVSTPRPDLPFDILRCANDPCDYPEKAGAATTTWSDAFGETAPSHPGEQIAAGGSHSADTTSQGIFVDLPDLRAASTLGEQTRIHATQARLKEKYPDTYDAIFGDPLMSRVSREAKVEVAVLLIEVFESPAVSEVLLQRLNIEFAQFLQLALGRVSDDLVLPSGGLLGNIGASLAEEVAIDVAAGAATDVFFSLAPPVNPRLEAPLRALLRSTIVELWGIKRGMTGDPGVILGKVLDRYYDIVEIANASRILSATQDQALLATALALETAAIVKATLPAETGETIIAEARRNLGFSTEDAVGADDTEAVERIFGLGLEALVAYHTGDAQTAREIRTEIARLGKAGGNINPFSAIINPVDWLTNAANWGQDAPERAARILIGSTALSDVTAPREEAAPADARVNGAGGEMADAGAAEPEQRVSVSASEVGIFEEVAPPPPVPGRIVLRGLPVAVPGKLVEELLLGKHGEILNVERRHFWMRVDDLIQMQQYGNVPPSYFESDNYKFLRVQTKFYLYDNGIQVRISYFMICDEFPSWGMYVGTTAVRPLGDKLELSVHLGRGLPVAASRQSTVGMNEQKTLNFARKISDLDAAEVSDSIFFDWAKSFETTVCSKGYIKNVLN